MARRMIADIRVGERVRWRDIVVTIEHLDSAETLALVSYRRPGQSLRHALVHLAELELLQ